MSDWPALLGALIVGCLMGLLFFQSLWVTVVRMPAQRHPELWMLGSLLLRFGLVLGVFYLLVSHGGWQHLLATAAGFTLVRLWLVHRLGREPET